MKKINIAIIGCGRIAEHHCRAINNNLNLNLSALCDLDKEKGEKVASQYNVPFYTNYRNMIEDIDQIDIVAIITPSGMHYEHAKEILETYKKSVIIEKPTVLLTTQLIELYKIAEKNKIKVFPVFQNRFNKAVQRVKQGILNKEIGEIILVAIRVRWCRPQRYYDLAPWRGTFSLDGGCMTNQGIHHIDLIRYLCGEVEEVNINTKTAGSNIEVEDVAIGNFKLQNNILGSLEITTAARPIDYEASISIVGSKGLAQIGGIAVNELEIYSPDPSQCELFSEDFSGSVYGNGHEILYEDIHEVMIKNKKEFIVSPEDNINTINLLNSLYVSDEQKRTISIDEKLESKRLGVENTDLFNLYRI